MKPALAVTLAVAVIAARRRRDPAPATLYPLADRDREVGIQADDYPWRAARGAA